MTNEIEQCPNMAPDGTQCRYVKGHPPGISRTACPPTEKIETPESITPEELDAFQEKREGAVQRGDRTDAEMRELLE